MGHGQHAKTHRKEFADDTDYRKDTDYEIIKAFYDVDDAAKWAKQIVYHLKDADKIPLHKNLQSFSKQNAQTGEAANG